MKTIERLALQQTHQNLKTAESSIYQLINKLRKENVDGGIISELDALSCRVHAVANDLYRCVNPEE